MTTATQTNEDTKINHGVAFKMGNNILDRWGLQYNTKASHFKFVKKYISSISKRPSFNILEWRSARTIKLFSKYPSSLAYRVF